MASLGLFAPTFLSMIIIINRNRRNVVAGTSHFVDEFFLYSYK